MGGIENLYNVINSFRLRDGGQEPMRHTPPNSNQITWLPNEESSLASSSSISSSREGEQLYDTLEEVVNSLRPDDPAAPPSLIHTTPDEAATSMNTSSLSMSPKSSQGTGKSASLVDSTNNMRSLVRLLFYNVVLLRKDSKLPF